MAFNELHLTSKSNFAYSDDSIGPSVPLVNSLLTSSETKDVVGLRLGIGLEQELFDDLSWTIDYIFTDYGKVDVFGQGDTTSNNDSVTSGGLTQDSSVRVNTQSLMLGIKYYF